MKRMKKSGTVRPIGAPTPAFTLLEILVVTAIVAVLLALLVPGLTHARRQAATSTCLSRIKEIGRATATYAAGSAEHIPPAAIDWHPTQEKKLGESGIEACDLPVNYGWAELLYEEMRPNALVTDFVEFEPGRWSQFPAQRNFQDKYERIFNCPQATKQVTHAGHFRVYLPGWANPRVHLDEEGRIDSVDPCAHNFSAKLSDVQPHLVLLGDTNEFASVGDYEGEPAPASRLPFVVCPSVQETSWIGFMKMVYTDCGAYHLVGCANSVCDECGNAKRANRFSHRHNGGADYLFGDLHAEWSTTLRHKLACDWDLNGVPDARRDDVRARSGCDPEARNP
ncbi:MAG: type II secretion system protein [Phycisphaerales bacterium]|nr:MAG: type II secretion system protein [Phycisphaerales bacterium]